MRTFNQFLLEYRPDLIRPNVIAKAATKVDQHLDKKYGYGTTKGGVSPIPGRNTSFGAQANYNSAEAGLRAIMQKKSKHEVGSAIHKGWGKTISQRPAAEPKQSQRQALKSKAYSELPKDEQAKDDVIGNRLRSFVKNKR
jgi:hypothetical protein